MSALRIPGRFVAVAVAPAAALRDRLLRWTRTTCPLGSARLGDATATAGIPWLSLARVHSRLAVVLLTALPLLLAACGTSPALPQTAMASRGISSTVQVAPPLPVSTAAPTVTPTPRPPLRFIRGPYTQATTTDSTLVCWAAEMPHSATVSYVASTSQPLAVRTPLANKKQCVTLSGLSAYTQYRYWIQPDGYSTTPQGSFRTLAGPTQPSISFVHFSDTHGPPPAYSALASLAKNLAPDFGLHSGDIVNEGATEEMWNGFLAASRELWENTTFYTSLGNHDLSGELYYSIIKPPGNGRWYSFDSGPAHFIALDTFFSPFEVGSEQRKWLEEDLRRSDRPWKVVFLHAPPYAAGGHGSLEPERERLGPLFERYGVSMVLSGHNHFYQRSVVRDLTFVVAGGGGELLYVPESRPNVVYAESSNHFLYVTIDGSVLTSRGVRADGSQFDKFTLSLTPGQP